MHINPSLPHTLSRHVIRSANVVPAEAKARLGDDISSYFSSTLGLMEEEEEEEDNLCVGSSSLS